MKLNKEAIDIMDFRHKTFNEHLKEINDIVTGRNTELASYIKNDDGNISDERIDRLISDLLECLKNYYQQLYGSLIYMLSEETCELYECFLYCAIQGMALVDVDILQYTEVEQVTTFSDIIDLLYNCDSYNSQQELLYIEQLGYPIASSCRGFFNNCDLAYEILTGTSIMSGLTDKEISLVNDMREKQSSQEVIYYDDDTDDYIKQIEREQLEQRPPLSAEELFDQFYGAPFEDEHLIPDDELEFCAKVEASQNEWKHSVVAPEKFIAKYLRYRELYFSISHSKMREDIEKMIDVFLYEQDLSAFALGEKYGIITYRSERYRNILKSEIRKARCK